MQATLRRMRTLVPQYITHHKLSTPRHTRQYKLANRLAQEYFQHRNGPKGAVRMRTQARREGLTVQCIRLSAAPDGRCENP